MWFCKHWKSLTAAEHIQGMDCQLGNYPAVGISGNAVFSTGLLEASCLECTWSRRGYRCRVLSAGFAAYSLQCVEIFYFVQCFFVSALPCWRHVGRWTLRIASAMIVLPQGPGRASCAPGTFLTCVYCRATQSAEGASSSAASGSHPRVGQSLRQDAPWQSAKPALELVSLCSITHSCGPSSKLEFQVDAWHRHSAAEIGTQFTRIWASNGNAFICTHLWH